MGRRFEPDGAHMMTLAEIHESGDYLTHEKLWIAAVKSQTFAYRNGDFLTNPGRWRGFEWENILNIPTRHTVLVVGHSDNKLGAETVEQIMDTSPIEHIFATNLSDDIIGRPGVHDLPLGIPNDEKQSRTHIIQADASLLRKAWHRGKPPIASSHLALYANFSIRNNPPERRAAWEAAESAPGARLGKFELSRRGRLRDLTSMKNSGLVVCPPGGGMDTHRFWEALLVGAIPVTLTSDHSARVARSLNLPVLTVNSWEDLASRDFLIQAAVNISGRAWDYSPLTSQFWLKKILSSVSASDSSAV